MYQNQRLWMILLIGSLMMLTCLDVHPSDDLKWLFSGCDVWYLSLIDWPSQIIGPLNVSSWCKRFFTLQKTFTSGNLRVDSRKSGLVTLFFQSFSKILGAKISFPKKTHQFSIQFPFQFPRLSATFSWLHRRCPFFFGLLNEVTNFGGVFLAVGWSLRCCQPLGTSIITSVIKQIWKKLLPVSFYLISKLGANTRNTVM